MERNFVLAEKQYSVSYPIRRYLYGLETVATWLYKDARRLVSVTGEPSGVLHLTACLCQDGGKSEKKILTHCLVATGIVDGEVVHHVGV